MNDIDELEQAIIDIGARYGWVVDNRGSESGRNARLPWAARQGANTPIFGRTRAELAEEIARWLLRTARP